MKKQKQINKQTNKQKETNKQTNNNHNKPNVIPKHNIRELYQTIQTKQSQLNQI